MYYKPQKSGNMSEIQRKKDHASTLSCYKSCLLATANNLISSNEKKLHSKEKIQNTSEFNTASNHNMTKVHFKPKNK